LNREFSEGDGGKISIVIPALNESATITSIVQYALNSPLVDEVIVDLKPDIARRRIEWRIEALPTVRGDPSLLRVVLQNLLDNAVKYTRPQRGTVIEIGSRRLEDGETAVYVRDNGVGFDMRYADRLFGVFQRLHRADEFEGTGIGLATARRVVHRHGGRIWGDGEPGRGACFYFTVQTA
jgi:light-regulated signal transduction histidine kinase (bacteriophytochrome)